MVDKNKNNDDDFEPFDDDDDAPDIDLDGDSSKLPSSDVLDGKGEKKDEDDEDLLLGDRPKIAENSQKNIFLIAAASLVVIYFLYQFTIGKEPDVPPPAKTEKERMEKKEVGKVAQNTEVPPVIEQVEQVKATDIIPPAPPPPVIEPPSEISIDAPSPRDILPRQSNNSQGGGQSRSNNSQNSGTSQTFKNPFDIGGLSSSDEIPGLPPLDDEGMGEPPGMADLPLGNDTAAAPNLQDESQNQMQKMQAPMMLVQGLEPRDEETSEEGEDAPEEEVFRLEPTPAEQTLTTKTWHLDSVILQGKVIDAVLETAINTDLPGRLRAIVSRDVYAESSKRILIPKGSRLIGAFDVDNQEFRFGRSRVLVIWTRVIRPDGIDAVFDEGSDGMIATDFLGRAGVRGQLDNRFLDIFGSAILLSSITIGFAYAAEELTGAQNNTQVGTQGQVIDTSSPTTQAVRQAVDQLGGNITNIADRMFEKNPRITVEQGTRIKIFVNRDIRFDRPITEGDEPIEIIQ